MLLSAAVNYPCQSWLLRHYRPRPAHSFTGPPPVRNPLQQTALVTSRQPWDVGPAASCPGLAPPTLCIGRRRDRGGRPGFVPAPPPRWLGKRHEKTLAHGFLEADDQMMGRSRSSQGMGFGSRPLSLSFCIWKMGVHSLFSVFANLFKV